MKSSNGSIPRRSNLSTQAQTLLGEPGIEAGPLWMLVAELTVFPHLDAGISPVVALRFVRRGPECKLLLSPLDLLKKASM